MLPSPIILASNYLPISTLLRLLAIYLAHDVSFLEALIESVMAGYQIIFIYLFVSLKSNQRTSRGLGHHHHDFVMQYSAGPVETISDVARGLHPQ